MSVFLYIIIVREIWTMIIDTDNLVSINEASQNFMQVLHQVEEMGEVIILDNNKPKYVVSKVSELKTKTDMDVLFLVAKSILAEHKKAFEVLG